MTDKEKAAPQEKQPLEQLSGCAEVSPSDCIRPYTNYGTMPTVTAFNVAGMVMGPLLELAQAAEMIHVDMGEGQCRIEKDESFERAVRLGRPLLLRIDEDPAFVLMPEPGVPGMLRVWLLPAFAEEVGFSV